MATTSNTYTGNGSNKLFSITFPYLDTSDIDVYLNGTLQTIITEYTFANATTVEFVAAPANGAVVLLDRSTDDQTLQATFFPGSSIKANDLNFNFDQVLYLSQETANIAQNQSTAGLQTQITAANNTSNTALTTANAATVTANSANTTATGIAGTANTALTNANAAVVTANSATSTANAATVIANSALSTVSGLSGVNLNRIINGNFDFWQRGTSFTGSEYGADRWGHGRIGTTHTVTRQSFTLGQTAVPNEPTYFCRTVVTSVAGAGNISQLFQRVEDVRTFAGKQVTVSFWAKVDATKNISIELIQYFGTGGSPSAEVTSIGVTKVSVGTSWQKVTVTTTLPSISGKTLGTDGNHQTALNIYFDAGSDFNARTDSLGQQSGTFDIAQVQLEPGAAATPFEQRSIGTELALCQRYFCKSYGIDVTPGSVSFNLGNPNSLSAANLAWIACNVSFPVTMRTNPSVSIYRPSTGAISTVEETGEGSPRTVSGIEAGASGIGLLIIDSNSPAAATAYQFQYTASAEL
jgi:hypothetical protein